MKPWWKNAIPHKDIREGRFDPSVFAIDLGEVTHGSAPEEYRDPAKFFTRTYMTNGLRELITKVLATLYKNEVKNREERISPVLQLTTPFGGGKTHSLLALYHLIKHSSEIDFMKPVKEILEDIGLESIPETNVASLDGSHLDPLQGEEKPGGFTVKTLWGEIAYQLGGSDMYERVREHDQKMICPGKKKLKEILTEASPCLLILDEVLEYIVKARGVEVRGTDLGGQTMAFMQELTGVVASLSEDKKHNSVLVITLPSSHLEHYDESSEKDYQTLKKITARIELRHSPVEGIEIYEILRRRLFEKTKEPDEAKRVAHKFHEILKDLGESVPKEFRDKEYQEKIEKAYPFHPELIDILYEKWGSLSGFQRTRGVLRFLALVVSDLYKKNDPSLLIMPGLVDFGNRLIKDELLQYLDEGFSSVVDSDVGGANAKCKLIDERLPSEFEKFEIASRIATLVFLHTSIDSGSPITTKRIRATTIVPDLSSPVINETLERMGNLWYLYSDEKQENWFFKKEPGISKIITEQEDALDDEEVLTFIDKQIAGIAGEGNVYIAPEDPSKIPDTEALKYIFLSVLHSYGEEEKEKTKRFCEKILNEHLPTSPRKRKNTLIFILPDSDKVGKIISLGRRFLALREIDQSVEIKENLTETQTKDLKNKLKNVKSRFSNELQIAYAHLLIPSEEGFDSYELGLNVLRAQGNTKDYVTRFLKENELLLEDVEPSILVSRTWPEDKNYITTAEIYEALLKYSAVEMISDKEVVRRSIAKGVSSGVFGYGLAEYPENLEGGKIKFEEKIATSNFELSEKAWLIKKEIAEKLIPKRKEKVKPKQEEGKELETEKEKRRKEPEEEATSRKVRINIDASNIRLADIFRGVIKPLKDETNDISVNIDIEAEGNLREQTLKRKVKETLQQLNTKYSMEEE